MKMTTNKRWAVIRATTGSVVRKFGSRDAARQFRRYSPKAYNTMIYDLVKNQAVR